jgi:large subunit ribosomal protein L17
MRHRNVNPKLGRTTAHRKALIRNMVTALFREERIHTTVPKAKEARRWAERVITVAKRGDLHSRRLAARTVQDNEVLKKLFEVVAPRFAERKGGYTRILKTGFRAGDNAPMSILELVGFEAAVVKEAPAEDAKKKGAKVDKDAAPKAKKEKKAPKEKSTAPRAKGPREKKASPKTKAPTRGGGGAPKQIGVKKSGRSGSGGKSG